MARRARIKSSMRRGSTAGTRTERLAEVSSACSETNRAKASRTGIALVRSEAASSCRVNG